MNSTEFNTLGLCQHSTDWKPGDNWTSFEAVVTSRKQRLGRSRQPFTGAPSWSERKSRGGRNLCQRRILTPGGKAVVRQGWAGRAHTEGRALCQPSQGEHHPEGSGGNARPEQGGEGLRKKEEPK